MVLLMVQSMDLQLGLPGPFLQPLKLWVLPKRKRVLGGGVVSNLMRTKSSGPKERPLLQGI